MIPGIPVPGTAVFYSKYSKLCPISWDRSGSFLLSLIDQSFIPGVVVVNLPLICSLRTWY